MFARNVSFHLKPGRKAEFTRLLDDNILPMLRKQKGFQNAIALVAPSGVDAVTISMWELKENAETYARSTYPGVLKTLEPVVEGTQPLSGSVFDWLFRHEAVDHTCTIPHRRSRSL